MRLCEGDLGSHKGTKKGMFMKEIDFYQFLKKNPSFASGWKSLQKISDKFLSDQAMNKVFIA